MTENQTKELIKEEKLSFINRAWWPLIAGILFAIIYYVVYKIIDPVSTDLDNFKILDIFSKYGQLFGFGLSLLALLLWYILYALKTLFRLKKWIIVNPAAYLLGVSLWGGLSYQFYFREARFTNIAKAIIDYVAQPLWYTCLVLAGFGVAWFVGDVLYLIFKKNK